MSPLAAALRSHRWTLLLAIAALGVVAALLVPPLLGRKVIVDVVRRHDLIRTVVASGHVEAPHRVTLGSQIVGTVKRISVAEGEVVKARQLLIELDDAELQAEAEEAEMAVESAQARLRQVREVQAPVAEQGVRQAQITLGNARTELLRNQDLFAQGFIGRSALDQAQKTADLAEAQLRAAQKQLETATRSGSDYAMATTALAQARANASAAVTRLRLARISAPVAGTLISRNVEVGDVVQPGQPLMVLSPAGETQLVVQIDEKNLRLLAMGQTAQASADAYADQRFDARLVYINPGIDAQRGSVEVKLTVPDPPAYLTQDMTVSVDLQVDARRDAVVVDLGDVHDIDSAEPWVLKVSEGRARRQPVRIGLRGGGAVEVLQGLEAGDRVVPATAAGIGDGSRLRPVPRSPGP